jgi:hypothetical protein
VVSVAGLVMLSALVSMGSLTKTRWLAVPAADWIVRRPTGQQASMLGYEPVDAGPRAARAPDASASSPAGPFASLAPVPVNKTLEAMVTRYKQAGTDLMFVTFANKDRFDFALTWAFQLCRLGLPHLAIGALDAETLCIGGDAGLPMFAMGAHGLGARDYGWNTPSFKLMGQDKVQLLIDVLRLNATAVLMDADAVLVSSPLPFFAAHPDADLLVPTDFTALGAMDGGLEDVRVSDHVINIGVVYARAATLPFALAWREILRADAARWDQTVFNELLKASRARARREAARPPDAGQSEPSQAHARRARATHARPHPSAATAAHTLSSPVLRSPLAASASQQGFHSGLAEAQEPALFAKRLWRTRSKLFAPITVGVLPIALFCSGHTWSVSKLPERARLAPIVYHTAFVFAGGEGKRHRMREHRVWYDQPSYYAPGAGEVGFLALDEREPPAELLRPPSDGGDGSGLGGLTIGWHFALVNWQLARVRSGLLLARALHRRFVMPRLICGFDRWWASHKGIIPNSATLLPVRECPMDHVFNLYAIPADWMPKEYSFLEHERCARAPRDGRRSRRARCGSTMPTHASATRTRAHPAAQAAQRDSSVEAGGALPQLRLGQRSARRAARAGARGRRRAAGGPRRRLLRRARQVGRSAAYRERARLPQARRAVDGRVVLLARAQGRARPYFVHDVCRPPGGRRARVGATAGAHGHRCERLRLLRPTQLHRCLQRRADQATLISKVHKYRGTS